MQTATSQDLAIATYGLSKQFGPVRAVDSIDLKIPCGIVYGFLGPNGAGKTTAIRMLATLIRPDRGTAQIFGHDLLAEPDAVRRRISLTGQFASVDEDLTGDENLVLIARLLGFRWRQARRRASELLEEFGLKDAARRQVKTYSGGMRRRIDIAASIVAAPDLLFLDEPTTGLDPRSRLQVWEIVRTLVRHGTTVLLTTQYLDEADQLADRIAVIDSGRIIAEGTSSELKSSAGAGKLIVKLAYPGDRDLAAAILRRRLPGRGVLPGDEPGVLYAAIERAEDAARAVALLADEGVELLHFSLGQPTLDEVFLKLTGSRAHTEPLVEPEGEPDRDQLQEGYHAR